MVRKIIFCLESAFVLSMLVLNLEYVQAQTPLQIAMFDPNGAAGACSNAGVDCVNSVISQDPSGQKIGIGLLTTGPFSTGLSIEADESTFNGTGVGLFNRADGNTNKWVIGTGGALGPHFFSIGDTIVYRLVIDDRGGNVGIGTLAPVAKLDVEAPSFGDLGLRLVGQAGIGGNMWVDGGGAFATYSLSVGGNNPRIGNGKVLASGYDTFSSGRWKTNIQTIQGALEKVERLRGVSFDWKEKGRHDIGLVAEEVAKVIPEVVSYEENGKDARGLDYARLTALLIEATKEQQSQIRELKAEINGLKALEKRTVALKEKDAEIAALKSRLDKLERMVRNVAYQTAWTGPTE